MPMTSGKCKNSLSSIIATVASGFFGELSEKLPLNDELDTSVYIFPIARSEVDTTENNPGESANKELEEEMVMDV